MSRNIYISVAMIVLAASTFASCDSVQPDSSDRLVVEAFFDTGQPLPTITVRKTVSLAASREEVGASMVSDAEIDVRINEVDIPYSVSASKPGQYLPVSPESTVLASGDRYSVQTAWREESALASGLMPPKIRVDSVLLDIPLHPVEAVLIDSLRLDSLGIDAQTGYLYAIEATLWWQAPEVKGNEYWVQSQLKPFTTFSSLVVDFFLLPQQIFPEPDATSVDRGRKWTGLYAVPVASRDAPLPEHRLRIALVRSGRDYADYALTRSSPDRREPTTNLAGAIGIVTGISVDSLVVAIDETQAGKRTIVTPGRSRKSGYVD